MKIPHKIKLWREIIRKDETKFDQAMDFYSGIIQSWIDEPYTVQGKLTDILKYHAGWLSFFKSVRADAALVAAMFEKRSEQIRGQVTFAMDQNPITNGKPSATALKALVEADPMVVDAVDKQYQAEGHAKQLMQIVETIEAMGYQLNNVSNIVAAGEAEYVL